MQSLCVMLRFFFVLCLLCHYCDGRVVISPSRLSVRVSLEENSGPSSSATSSSTHQQKSDGNMGTLLSRAAFQGGNVRGQFPSMKGWGSLPPASAYSRPLLFLEAMVCGAVSRSTAQTIVRIRAKEGSRQRQNTRRLLSSQSS